MNKKLDYIPFVFVSLFIITVAIANWQHCYNLFRAFANHGTAISMALSVEIAVCGLAITGLWFKSFGTKAVLYVVLTILVFVQMGATAVSSFLYSERGMQEVTKTYRGYATTDTVRVDLSEQSTKRLSDFLFVFGVKVSSDSVRVLFSIFSVIMPLLAYLSEIALAMHFNRQRKEINLKQLQIELEKKQKELSRQQSELGQLSIRLDRRQKEFSIGQAELDNSWEKLRVEQEVLDSKIHSFEQERLKFAITKEVIEKTEIGQLDRDIGQGLDSGIGQLDSNLGQQIRQRIGQNIGQSLDSKTKGEQFIHLILNTPKISQNEAGRRIGIKHSSMSLFVRKYCDRGLITRQNCEWKVEDIERAIVFAKDGGSGE